MKNMLLGHFSHSVFSKGGIFYAEIKGKNNLNILRDIFLVFYVIFVGGGVPSLLILVVE